MSGKKILLVTADEKSQTSGLILLSRLGYDVTIAQDYFKALDLAKAENYYAILLGYDQEKPPASMMPPSKDGVATAYFHENITKKYLLENRIILFGSKECERSLMEYKLPVIFEPLTKPSLETTLSSI